MRVLVLGGTGFIGSHAVDLLIACGHTVRVYSRGTRRYESPGASVEYVTGRIDDVENLSAALAGVDVVLHCASTTIPATSNEAPVFDVSSNLIPLIRLLDEMRRLGILRIVFLSSGGTVYGRTNVELISESHSCAPVCSYGITKVAMESYLLLYCELYGLVPTILRPANPFGERQGRVAVQGVVGTFLEKARDGSPITIWGDGSVIRDYIYVEDLARACVMAIESNIAGILNIGSGSGRTLLEVAKCVEKVTGVSLSFEFREARKFDVARSVLDISKAHAKLGWQPATSFEQGVSRHWDWLQRLSS